MIDLDTLKFDDRGLIPAIVQDAKTGKVLTLAYMNRESLEISMREGRTAAEIRDAALESARESIRNLREIYQ